jgi:hypothetical protein
MGAGAILIIWITFWRKPTTQDDCECPAISKWIPRWAVWPISALVLARLGEPAQIDVVDLRIELVDFGLPEIDWGEG